MAEDRDDWEHDHGDYKVGYRRPPRHTQYPKGISGNPTGRPRGSTSAAAVTRKALLVRVPVRENGRHKRITKLEAIIMQAVNQAASGDHRARDFLFRKFRWLENMAELAKRRGLSAATVEAIRSAMRGDSEAAYR